MIEHCKLPPFETVLKENILALDVGPVLRRFLTRAEYFCDGRYGLTLVNELRRGQVPE